MGNECSLCVYPCSSDDESDSDSNIEQPIDRPERIIDTTKISPIRKNIVRARSKNTPTLDDLFRLCQDQKEDKAIEMVQENPDLITKLTPQYGNGLLIYITSHRMENLAIKVLKLNSQISLLEREDNKYSSYDYAKKYEMIKLIDFWNSSCQIDK